MIMIFADRSPAGEQRPHAAKVVSRGIVPLIARRDDAHAPIALLIPARQHINHLVRLVLVKHAEPHRHRRQDAWSSELLVGGIQRKCKAVIFSRPKKLID